MKLVRSLIAATLLVATGLQSAAEDIIYYAPHGGVEYRDSGQKTIPPGAPTLVVTRNGLTFNVYFEDVRLDNNIGFDSPAVGAQARARFQDALNYVADVLNQPGSLDIVVTTSQTDGGGALASAGTFYSTTPGFQQGTTLQRLTSGLKPFPGTEEISATVDFGFNWNFTTGNPTNAQVDFQSVILHELTHGLGFSSLSNSTGGSQVFGGVYARFDQFIRRNTGSKVLFSGNHPSFQGISADLVSNDLVFFGPQADTLYAPAARPGIFAPNPFQGGSSMSHWDTGNIVGGAVMEHAIVFGAIRREFAPLEIGALRDIGFVNAADPGATPANLTVSPNPGGGQTFGSVGVGGNSTVDFTVTNTGGQAAVVTAATTAPFSVIQGANLNIPAGGSGIVRVRFNPANLGLATRTLTITGDPDGPINISIFGVGIDITPGNLITSPSIAGGINLGNVNLGSNSEFAFTLSNDGGTAITGTASTTAPFSVVAGANYTLNAGASTTVRVRFTPAGVGAVTRVLTLTGDPDGNITTNLNGTGVAPPPPPNLVTNPNIAAGTNFGQVESGAAATRTITLQNTGGLPLIGNASTTGAGFSITSGAAYNIAAGASTTVVLRFAPGDTGNFTGQLILTGDPDGNLIGALTGTGIKAAGAMCSASSGAGGRWSGADALVVLGVLAGLWLTRRGLTLSTNRPS